MKNRAGYWWEVWRRYRRSRLGLLALFTVIFLVVVAAAAPFIAGTRPIACRYKGNWYFPVLGHYNPRWENPIFFPFRIDAYYPRGLKKNDPDSLAIFPLLYVDPDRRLVENEWPSRPGRDPISAAPSWQHPFGTDALGRDVLGRMVHGASIALLVGFVAMGIATVIGLLVGGLAGYFGGWVDMVCSRLIEVFLAIPAIVLILAMIAIVEHPTVFHMMAVLGFTRWTGIARYLRGEFMRLREMDFIISARALGVPWYRIMFRHMLPNALAPVVVAVTFGIAGAILLESSLSFLGLGTNPTGPSWGVILSEGFGNLNEWWLVFFPGLAIFVTVLVYNLVGDTFQEASDPRLK